MSKPTTAPPLINHVVPGVAPSPGTERSEVRDPATRALAGQLTLDGAREVEVSLVPEVFFGPVLSMVQAENFEAELDLINAHDCDGRKRSLFGDNDIHGPERARSYTRLKTATLCLPRGVRAGADFAKPTLT